MICPTCDGSGEGMSEYSGPCLECKGKGEVPDVCGKCGRHYIPDPDYDDDICGECREEMEEMEDEA